MDTGSMMYNLNWVNSGKPPLHMSIFSHIPMLVRALILSVFTPRESSTILQLALRFIMPSHNVGSNLQRQNQIRVWKDYLLAFGQRLAVFRLLPC